LEARPASSTIFRALFTIEQMLPSYSALSPFASIINGIATRYLRKICRIVQSGPQIENMHAA
jgi:hypothetical protein